MVRPRRRSHSADQRIVWLGLLVVVGGILLAGRTLLLPVLPAVATLYGGSVPALRGSIEMGSTIRPGTTVPLAANASRWLVAADPRRVVDAPSAATALGPLLAIDRTVLLERLTTTSTVHSVLARGVTDAVQERVAALELPGITLEPETVRVYPLGPASAHVTGFLGYDGDVRVGQYGLEAAYDRVLRGTAGDSDATVEDGADVLTTLDRELQDYACTKLAGWVEQHGASGGSVVVINPKTGAVLALCGAPSYDPNAYGSVEDAAVFLNPAVSNPYEPGSVFKPITMAAALDAGVVTPESTYEDTGSVTIGRYTIRNSDEQAHGVQSMQQVLEQSLNTGAIFAAQQLGVDAFDAAVHRFGFGARTNVDLPAESRGDVSNLDTGREINLATASFGQGITVTTLQLAMAYAAFANQGELMQPYLVDRVLARDGTETVTQPRAVRQVVTPATATQLTAMLVGVVERGHGTKAGVPGYFIAGKTGTAQIPNRDAAGYEAGVTIGTFAGYGPVDDPRFAMVVRVDRPRDVQFAESSAAPLFGDIAGFILRAYGVAPTRPVPVP